MIRDSLERIFWTAVVTGLTSAPVTQVAVSIAGGSLDGLATAGLALAAAFFGGAVNAVLLIARERLSVLPNPGGGLPGLPTDR